MNLNEFMFMLQFIVFILCFFLALYNIFNMGKVYDIKKAWILLCVVLVCMGVGMVLVMTSALLNLDDTNLTYSILYQFQSWLMLLYGVFFIINLIFVWRSEALTSQSARNSIEARNIKN